MCTHGPPSNAGAARTGTRLLLDEHGEPILCRVVRATCARACPSAACPPPHTHLQGLTAHRSARPREQRFAGVRLCQAARTLPAASPPERPLRRARRTGDQPCDFSPAVAKALVPLQQRAVLRQRQTERHRPRLRTDRPPLPAAARRARPRGRAPVADDVIFRASLAAPLRPSTRP